MLYKVRISTIRATTKSSDCSFIASYNENEFMQERRIFCIRHCDDTDNVYVTCVRVYSCASSAFTYLHVLALLFAAHQVLPLCVYCVHIYTHSLTCSTTILMDFFAFFVPSVGPFLRLPCDACICAMMHCAHWMSPHHFVVHT